MPTIADSTLAYAETVARLAQAISAGGNTIFATIDQSAAAAGAGLALRPTTLIIFGNPKAGTPLMDSVPLSGLDLPLKLLVWEDGTTTHVAYTPAAEIAGRYQLTGKDALIGAMDAALTKLVATIT